eukprot:scaffold694574_cov55-Attheya_sp.AAC.3
MFFSIVALNAMFCPSLLPLLLLEEDWILLITAVFIGDVKADVIETALTARMVDKSFMVTRIF